MLGFRFSLGLGFCSGRYRICIKFVQQVMYGVMFWGEVRIWYSVRFWFRYLWFVINTEVKVKGRVLCRVQISIRCRSRIRLVIWVKVEVIMRVRIELG